MELESMKSLWEAHDKQVRQVSELNEQLIRHIIKEKSHSALERIKNTEYILGGITLLFLLPFLFMCTALDGDTVMIFSYCICLAAFLITLLWGVYKIIYLSRIDISGGTVTEVASRTKRFQLFMVKERLVSILSFFVVAPAMYILLFRWIRHSSAFEHPEYSLTEIIIVLIFGILFSLIMYRRVYFNNLQRIIANLKEIEAFRNETTE